MNPTERFSDRVANYVEYRPSYPQELIATLTQACELQSDSVIADIGSGTGKLSQLFLDHHYRVHAVEPNKEMREAAESLFKHYDGFISIEGEAASTNLPDQSVDLIIAGQAFHWFEPVASKIEFNRILKPTGRIALVWNQRDLSTPLQQEYDAMLERYCPGYTMLNHRSISDTDIEQFCSPKPVVLSQYSYTQRFDVTGFIGRMNSSSYTPKQDTPEYHALCESAEALFEKNKSNGEVKFAYVTHLYLA